VALIEFFQDIQLQGNRQEFSLYEIGGADGTNAITLTECAQGLIVSLSDTPNPANRVSFKRHCKHNYSSIHVGPFVDVTPSFLEKQYVNSSFSRGFDVIYENTTFQMYNKDRSRQIAYTKRVLNSNGIFIFLEKYFHPLIAEYDRRERIKDECFKSKYFTEDQIKSKKEWVLSEMEKGQVTLDEMVNAIKEHFSYVYMIWNSVNFYELAASNSRDHIELFLGKLGESYVPDAFAFEIPMIKEL
jgi:hypothetical protein